MLRKLLVLIVMLLLVLPVFAQESIEARIETDPSLDVIEITQTALIYEVYAILTPTQEVNEAFLVEKFSKIWSSLDAVESESVVVYILSTEIMPTLEYGQATVAVIRVRATVDSRKLLVYTLSQDLDDLEPLFENAQETILYDRQPNLPLRSQTAA